MPKRIACLGSAPSSIRFAPFDDPSWTIWGCSPALYPQARRIDAWWELHRMEEPVIGQAGLQVPWFSPEYIQWLKQLRVPLYMATALAEYPTSVAYPIRQMIDKYGPYVWTSSLAYMVILAMEDPECVEIGMWGVDMAACTSGDTKILTADLRWIRADEAQVGDKLLAFDEEPQQVGEGTASRFYREAEVLEASRLTKPCYRVTLEDGREIICSDDHRWLTYAENTSRWKETKDLVTPQHREDRPTRIIKLTDVWAEDKSWEAGYLAAAFDGEGHLSQNLRNGKNGVLRAGFAQRDNPMSELVADAMGARGFKFTKHGTPGGTNDNCFQYSVAGGRAETLRMLGSIRPRRLLDKFRSDDLGMMQKIGTVAVVSAEFIGDYPVIGLRTSTKTFIAEGLASHNTEEYKTQRPALQFLAVECMKRGIKFTIPPESDLLQPSPLYGIDEASPMAIKMLARKKELEGRLGAVNQSLNNMQIEASFLRGAIDDVSYCIETWTSSALSGTPVKTTDRFVPKLVQSGD